MIPFNGGKENTKSTIISEELIKRITHHAPPREQAFFTIMRQTGLPAKTIVRLRLRNLEASKRIPIKIDVDPELTPKRAEKLPIFIGLESKIYIDRYLAERKTELTLDSLLFVTKDYENKAVNTKNVSRTFREILVKLNNVGRKMGQRKKLAKSEKGNFSLRSLTAFYRANTKHYREAIKNNPNKYDYYYRKLYKVKALPFLEIESLTSYKIIPDRREFRKAMKYAETVDNKNRELTKTIVRDKELISSIFTLLYNNSGDFETRENEVIGENFIKLWKEVSDKQTKNLKDSWNSRGKIILLPYTGILEELTKTLKRIKKPYDELEKQTAKIS